MVVATTTKTRLLEPKGREGTPNLGTCVNLIPIRVYGGGGHTALLPNEVKVAVLNAISQNYNKISDFFRVKLCYLV